MPKNKVQFQKGLSLPAFLSLYGTEQQCRYALARLRRPDGFSYPKCGHTGYSMISTRHLYQCSQCQHQASVTSGTIFAST